MKLSGDAFESDAQRVRKRWVRRALWVLATTAASVLLVAAVWSSGNRLHRYVTQDAGFCRTCHLSKLAEVVDPSHEDLPCSDCHRVRFWSGVSQYVLNKVSGGARSTPHSEPDRTRCLQCHQGRLAGVRRLSRTVGHAAHVFAKVKLGCEECHGKKAHTYKVANTDCVRCHEKLKVVHAGMRDVPCLSCHNFLAGTIGKTREPAIDCRPCHGGPEFPAQSGEFVRVAGQLVGTSQVHGSLDNCQLCHNPHEPDPAQQTKGQGCSKCHSHVTSEVHQRQAPNDFDCNSCHTTHIVRAQFREACVRCHKQPRPKPGQALLAVTHSACTDCHAAHEFEATRDGCLNCHRKKRDSVKSWKAHDHADCLNCHAPHEAGAERSRCGRCHQKRPGRGHTSCVECHDPHVGRAAVKPCTSCHGAVPAQLAAGNPKHSRDCATCHPPHDTRPGRTWCGKCHQQQPRLVRRARPARHRSCASCHRPHQFAANRKVCDSCHQIAADGPHTGPCQKCHKSHGPPKPAGGCGSCHAKQARQARASRHNCRGCHEPHKRAVDWWSRCGSCHRPQVQAAATRGKTHGQCESCHRPHAFRTPTCTSCHKKRSGEHKRRGHRRCLQCHASHQKKLPSRRDCLGCHRNLTDHYPDANRCTGCHPFQ